MEVYFDFNDQNLERLRRALVTMPERSAGLLGNSLLAGARKVEAAAQATTRFRDRTGRLRAAIHAEKVKARFPLGDGRWISRQGAARVVVNEPYAHIVELGREGRDSAKAGGKRSRFRGETFRLKGRFFLQNATETTRPEVLAAITDYLRRRIKGLARYGL